MLWKADDIETVKTMWADRKSASEIGAVIGRTRNAVIGKVDRLGMLGKGNVPGRPTGNATAAPSVTKTYLTPRFIKVAAKAYTPRIPEIVLQEPVSMSLELVDLEHDNCRFSTGHDDHKGHLFCGHTVKERTSWCAYHCERVFQKREVVK